MNRPNLTDVLTVSAFPILKASGFERKGREFRLVNTRGWEAHLGFYPNALHDSMGVFVIYGMATPLHLRWCRDHGFAADPWVGQSETLLRVQAYAPGWVDKDATPDVDPYRWSFSDDRSAADLGELLAARLREEVVPRLQAWFDADQLATAALTGTSTGFVAPCPVS